MTALTRGVVRVAAGDLAEPLPVRSADELGQLTRAFNAMQDGLRQRDFIRDTFGRYVSPGVVQALLGSPEGLRLGGEMREVTILMSDLRGYTQLAGSVDPTVVVQVLNGYLGRMTDVILEHSGTIDEFVGDAIFAIFGAPMPLTDHPERAAACALAMQRAMVEVNGVNAARGLPQIAMGIGLNTGEAVVGNIGSEKRAKYGVVGSTVNLAARIQGCTTGGQVFVSTETYARIRDVAEVGAPLSVELKGIRELVTIHELQALRSRRAPPLGDASGHVDPRMRTL